MHLEDDEDRDAALVLADELEEHGDPRAALVRAQLTGADTEALVQQHWADWVGALDPKTVLLRWSAGQLREVCVGQAPAGWTVDELLSRETARGVRRLALSAAVSSSGVERASALRELVCFGPLEARALPTVQALSLGELDAAMATALATLDAPRLRALHTRSPTSDPRAQLFAEVTKTAPPPPKPRPDAAWFDALTRARWFDGLTTWTHRANSLSCLQALASSRRLAERQGAGLVVLCPPALLAQVPPEVQRALPRAELRLLPTPEPARDPEDSHGPVEVHVLPTRAPMNFRALAPTTTTTRPGTQSDIPSATSVGSGVPMTSEFSSCGWCGSADTRKIYDAEWSSYSHFETTTYSAWEYECRACGLFNRMFEMRTR